MKPVPARGASYTMLESLGDVGTLAAGCDVLQREAYNGISIFTQSARHKHEFYRNRFHQTDGPFSADISMMFVGDMI